MSADEEDASTEPQDDSDMLEAVEEGEAEEEPLDDDADGLDANGDDDESGFEPDTEDELIDHVDFSGVRRLSRSDLDDDESEDEYGDDDLYSDDSDDIDGFYDETDDDDMNDDD